MSVSAKPLLQAKDLYCERDDRILFAGLSFAVQAGQILQIEGPNGSGKTTLIRILCGLSQDFEGSLYWQGQPLDKVAAGFRQSCVYFGHNTGVKLALTAEENLNWMAQIKGLSLGSSELAQRIQAVLARVGLLGFEDVPLYTLSAGQKRRVALASLLLEPVPLWILDEPFTAIDKKGVAELEQLIIEQANEGRSVILTTHHELAISPDKLQKLTLGNAASPKKTEVADA
ncbi:MAG: heme ABC transporter ATP-binding protein CcmA [Gammaproteobacteria bacterium]|nr:MAG: heme ABC transporter ATP-binding protein CcmA [Gammaproteobacteria bacterium]